MRTWLVFVLLWSWMALPFSARAQGSIKLDLMSIELLSEYDQPSMLVINQFVLSADTTLPATITLRFPKEGNLVAVAVETNGELFNKDFSRPDEQGDWQAVTVKVESYEPHRIEYYQPLTRDGDKRQFQLEWFGDYYVKEFAVNVLVPADSTELVTSPVLEDTDTASGGAAITGAITKQHMKMGNSFRFKLEYQRTSESLINPSQSEQIQPSEPVGPETAGRVSISNFSVIIAGVGVALIGIALFAYWRSTKTAEPKPRRRRRHAPATEEESQAYCHECGTRAQAGDRFCRTCGSRLRTE